ncbi:catalase family protein [Acinetobacter pittii]|uniref:catalase family protein n=1 Tax=Acinetobacter TaxID=469 RepID=UPI0003462FD1|nr:MULTISPECIES: catalase family protein [Acinetobacter]AVZ04848.1 catalase family protein [Acinetobacter pittii]KQE13012.1 catalase [Acinetobacter pittii]MBN6508894.1 catalase family protein [Acinetobacter pittii]MBT1524935.1 catalase family protein [Acinetobacter pittii]MCH2010723.1 catalase family protein [Acinetobacter pittii]
METFIQPISFKGLFLFTPLVFALSGCTETLYSNTTSTTKISSESNVYPEIDAVLGEKLQPNEELLAQNIAQVIEKSIREQYTAGNALRDAHPKAHGCVRADFHVSKNIPVQFAKGMFIPDRSYQAWIRFSNASNDASNADIKKDARGIAIKILGVSGQKILESEKQATTQDFIMINHPVFFANDAKRYLSFMNDVNSHNMVRKLHIPFALGFKGTMNALGARNSQIANPLYARYWSMVPYQLGLGNDRQAVKYSVRACSMQPNNLPKNPNHDFLREALKNTLQSKDACMEFLIQPRTSNQMLVEDSMTEWDEKAAPFYQVATIHIPKQNFDTPEQNKFCENLSFTPWHALPEHKPLGAVNRMRKVIYENISRVRHDMNSAPRQEP